MATKKAKKPGRPIPRGLEQAVGKAAKHVDGRYCYGLPHPLIVANGLAQKLAGFTGVSLSHLKR